MFRNMFGGGRRSRASFRPRHDKGGVHFIFPLVIGVASGYYIFNEPLKQAAMEVKAKEAKKGREALQGDGGAKSGSASSDSNSNSSIKASSSGGNGGGSKVKPAGAGDGDPGR